MLRNFHRSLLNDFFQRPWRGKSLRPFDFLQMSVFFFYFYSCSLGSLSDIIVFDYFISGQRVSELDKNEIVFLNFSNKTNCTLKQVS